MKKMIVLGAMLGVAALGEPALAQTPKSPDAVVAQRQAEAKPAPDDLVTMLETKGILTETEAALVRQKPLPPETRQVLAEMLLSKHLISRDEYDRTLQDCPAPFSAVPAAAASQPVSSSSPGPEGDRKPSRFQSFSDWVTSILPGGGQTTDADFGVIQPSPRYSSPDQAAAARAQAKAKAEAKAKEKEKRKSQKHNEQDASQTTSPPK